VKVISRDGDLIVPSPSKPEKKKGIVFINFLQQNYSQNLNIGFHITKTNNSARGH
jgi:formylmethanofuran dehydrogenase subunit D